MVRQLQYFHLQCLLLDLAYLMLEVALLGLDIRDTDLHTFIVLQILSYSFHRLYLQRSSEI